MPHESFARARRLAGAGLALAALEGLPASADSLTFARSPVSGGQAAQVALQASLPSAVSSLVYEVRVTGTNRASAPPSVIVTPDHPRVVFAVQTSPTAAGEEEVDLEVTPRGAARPSAIAHLRVVPGILRALTLDRSEVVGGASVLGAIELEAASPAAGVTVPLLHSCSNCGADAWKASFPASVAVPGGASRATFPIRTQGINPLSGQRFTVTASLGEQSRSVHLEVGVPRPVEISAAPQGGPARYRITVTLDAPAFPGYALAVGCSPRQICACPPALGFPAGQTSASLSLGPLGPGAALPFEVTVGVAKPTAGDALAEALLHTTFVVRDPATDDSRRRP